MRETGQQVNSTKAYIINDETSYCILNRWCTSLTWMYIYILGGTNIFRYREISVEYILTYVKTKMSDQEYRDFPEERTRLQHRKGFRV
jgi:hypothetical protein